jgi:hypothetical protein
MAFACRSYCCFSYNNSHYRPETERVPCPSCNEALVIPFRWGMRCGCVEYCLALKAKCEYYGARKASNPKTCPNRSGCIQKMRSHPHCTSSFSFSVDEQRHFRYFTQHLADTYFSHFLLVWIPEVILCMSIVSSKQNVSKATGSNSISCYVYGSKTAVQRFVTARRSISEPVLSKSHPQKPFP